MARRIDLQAAVGVARFAFAYGLIVGAGTVAILWTVVDGLH